MNRVMREQGRAFPFRFSGTCCTRFPWWFAAALGVGVGACGEGPGQDESDLQWPAVRDSAGIQIVESDGGAVELSLGWDVGDVPELEIGAHDGDVSEAFHLNRGVLQFPDDRVLVVDGSSRELRFFSSGGALEQTTGGAGDGPGRFRGAPQLVPALSPDSVLVFDGSLQRFSVFSSDGSHLRTHGPLDPTASHFDVPFGNVMINRASGVVGQVGDRVVTYHSMSMTGDPGLQEEPWEFRLVAPDGHIDRVIRSGTMAHQFTTPSDALGQSGRFAVPFSVLPRGAVGPAGFYLLTDGLPEVEFYNSEGVLVRLLRLTVPPREIDDTDLDEYIALRMATAPSRAVAELYDREYRRVPLPERMPVFDAVVVDTAGCLWARLYHLTDQRREDWLVFDPDGHARGTVSVPSGVDVHQVGFNFVLGVSRGNSGIQRVHRYHLERAGPGADRICGEEDHP